MHSVQPDLHARTARLLECAVAECGRSQSEIARRAGLKRDTLRRSLSGARAVTLPEVLAILDAAKLPGEQTLLFMLLAGEEFALERSGTSAAEFLVEFLRRVPLEVVEHLGDEFNELRPRWALGTAKMLARTLSQHVADLNRRGEAIGDRQQFTQLAG